MNPLTKISIGATVAIGAAALLFVLYLMFSNAHLKTQLAQTQTSATLCHSANDDFAAQIIRQNRTVENMRRDHLVHEKQAQDAAQSARRQAAIYQKAAQGLAIRKTGHDLCAASDDLINSYLTSMP